MINSKALQWALVLFCCFCFSYKSLADTTTNPVELNLSDGTIANPQFGCPSGTTAAQVNSSNWGTKTVRFGECINTFAISYAINQALQGVGISIDKVHYNWRYVHCFNTPGQSCNSNIENRVNTSTGEITDTTYWDELTVVIEVTDSSGNVVETKTWNMDKWYKYNGDNSHSSNEVKVGSTRWQIHEDNIEVYNHLQNSGTIRTPNSLGDVRFRVTGYDKGNWDGFYGPVISKFQTWFTYRTNPCTQTALYDASCPGYSEAYAIYTYNTACASSALYDSGCPGYAAAYYTQQCNASALYDSGCSGYAAAYYTQQCNASALYDSGCNGYAEAYYSQQCGISALYDSGCTGYEAAYFTYQCTANPLYNSACSGYTAAYLAQQCGINSLYDSACPNYATEYYKAQCKLSPLYDSGCDGHKLAQCDANPLYDFTCTGYSKAYLSQQCLYNPQYDKTCTGYIAPIVAPPTSTNPIVIPGAGTGDTIVDSIIALPPKLPELIIMPQPEIKPTPEVTLPTVIDTKVPVIEAPVIVVELTIVDNIEAQVDKEIEAQLMEEVIVDEPIVEEIVTNDTQEEKEEDTDTVNETVEDTGEDTGSTESDETDEAEEVTEEAEVVEEKAVDEKVVEEKAVEEKKVVEEVVVAKKPTKKIVMTKKQKRDAKIKKMREIIKNKLKALAITMGKAVTLEQQQALQAQINALINFVPGFNAYGKQMIPGVDFYTTKDIYRDRIVPENNRGLLNGLASQILHEKMVDMQYEGMK